MATIKYYSYSGGNYTENPFGPLLGIEWADASGNKIRAVLFLMDFSTLIYGQEITMLYQAEVKATGTTAWLLRDRQTFRISNAIKVVPDFAQGLSKLFLPELTEAPPEDAVGLLDLFISLYLKGDKYPPGQLEPMYWWIADVLARLEGQTLDTTHVFLAETLALIMQLEGLGIFLTIVQKIALDNYLRSLPAPPPAMTARSMDAEPPAEPVAIDLMPEVIAWLKKQKIDTKGL